jgi:hypothetical protein
MPLFRFHRGSLAESLDTTIIIDNCNELYQLLSKDRAGSIHITIDPYPSEKNCFDKRIGWYTQIVKINNDPIGFLSEPLRR